jgi:hypothetical protein
VQRLLIGLLTTCISFMKYILKSFLVCFLCCLLIYYWFSSINLKFLIRYAICKYFAHIVCFYSLRNVFHWVEPLSVVYILDKLMNFMFFDSIWVIFIDLLYYQYFLLYLIESCHQSRFLSSRLLTLHAYNYGFHPQHQKQINKKQEKKKKYLPNLSY